MKRRPAFSHRFFALLTILSLSLTQACPAWALRAQEPGEPGHQTAAALKAGLEAGTLETASRSAISSITEHVLGPDKVGIVHSERVEAGDCGCFVRVGKPKSQGGLDTNQMVLTAARELEFRGYQSASAGVITMSTTGAAYVGRKVLGGHDELEQILVGQHADPLPDGNIQVVHVRWPTQGMGTIDNQHPTPLKDGMNTPAELELIFNGDIKNFREIDEWLAARGIRRPRGVATDAWTIGALIWYYFQQPSEEQIRPMAVAVFDQTRSFDQDANWTEAEKRLKAQGIHMSLLEAVNLAYGHLQGDFAFVVVSEKEPDKAIGVKKGQKPLIVGRGETPEVGNFIASEASTFIDHTTHHQSMKSGDIVVITEGNAVFYKREGLPGHAGHFALKEIPERERPLELLLRDEIRPTKQYHGVTYPTFTQKEIAEQPDALRHTLSYEDRPAVLRDRMRGRTSQMPGVRFTDEDIRNAKGIMIIAMGTAAHAGESVAPFMEEELGFSVQAHLASNLYDLLRGSILRAIRRIEPTFAGIPEDVEGWADLVKMDKYRKALRPLFEKYKGMIGIAVSQSGNTMDTNQPVILLQAFGMRFLGIVNKPVRTPLVELTEYDGGSFRTRGGSEIGVASTKAYVSQVMALRVLSLYFGLVRQTLQPEEAERKLHDLEQLPDLVETWLNDRRNHEFMQQVGAIVAAQRGFLYMGRGSLVPVAKEGGLKELELAYGLTPGMDLNLMKHGYIALFPESNNKRVAQFSVSLLTDRVSLQEALGNLSEIRARHGNVIAVVFEGDREKITTQDANYIVTVPDVPDELAAVVSVLPLQLLAVETTKAINKISTDVSDWAEELYWLLTQRAASHTAIPDAQLTERIRVVGRRLLRLANDGRIDMLPLSLGIDLQTLIQQAIESGDEGSTIALDAHTRNLIRVLRGPRLSLTMFFDHELSRFQDGTMSDVSEQERHDLEMANAIFMDVNARVAQGSLSHDKAMKELGERFGVLLSQAIDRGSPLKDRYKEWRFDKGLGEYLRRDLDKPRGLAKEVTVGRLSNDLRQKLSELGLPAGVIDGVFSGTQELAGSQIREYPNVMRVIALLSNVPETTLRRWSVMHEQAHYFLREIPSQFELLALTRETIDEQDAVDRHLRGAGYIPFRNRFEQEFGTFESEDSYIEEVLAKYISARLTGQGMELFGGLAPALDRILAGTHLRWSADARENLIRQTGVTAEELARAGVLPATLGELFDPNFIIQYGPRQSADKNKQVIKAAQLSQLAQAIGLSPDVVEVNLVDQFEDDAEWIGSEIQNLLDQLARQERAEAPIPAVVAAGLEQGSLVGTHSSAQPIRSIFFAPKGNKLATVSQDQQLRFWPLANLTEPIQPVEIQLHRGIALETLLAALSPEDLTTVALVSQPDIVRLANMQSGKIVAGPFKQENQVVESVAFSPTGKTLAVASGSHRWREWTIRLWDISSGMYEDFDRDQDTSDITDLTFDSKGGMLASAHKNGTIQLWDVSTMGKSPDGTFSYPGSADAIAFYPGNKILAAGGASGVVFLNVADRKELYVDGISFYLSMIKVGKLAFSPDGNTLATIDANKEIRLWDVTALRTAAARLPAVVHVTELAAPMPGPLQRIRDRVDELIDRFEDDPRVDFIAEPGPEEGQTTLVIIGRKDEPGLLEILTGPIAEAGINVSDHGPYDTDDAGLSYVVVDASAEELDRKQGAFGGKRSAFEEIQSRIGKRYPSEEEERLRFQLVDRRLSDREIDWLVDDLYRSYEGVPRVLVGQEAGATTILGIFPYEPPLPDIDQRLAEALARRAQKEAAEQRTQVPQIVPSSIFTHELDSPRRGPVAFVLITLPLSQQQITDLGVIDEFENFLSRLSGKAQAGLEAIETGIAPVGVPGIGFVGGQPVAPTVVADASATRTEFTAAVTTSETAGAPVATATTAGTGIVSSMALKAQLDSLPPLVLTSSDSVAQVIYGVVAGPQGLAPGVALSKQAYNADGLRIPVIFIARHEAQAAGLEALGVDPTFIYRVDPSGPYPTIAVAEERASALLASMGVTRVVPLGVTNPVPPLLLVMLENLFGIRLDNSPAIELWQRAITQAGLEIQA